MQVLYLGRAPRTKETLPDFLKWRRVTRPPLVFRGLTGSQWTPGFGVSQCQSSKDARPVRRRGQPTSRRHARNYTGQHGRGGVAPYHQPTLAERVGLTHQTNTMPQKMRQARKGQNLVTQEEQNLDPHREADREGETSHTREHGPYQPPGKDRNEERHGRNNKGDGPILYQ